MTNILSYNHIQSW